ncbi:winged helix-turn-helix domain-containing protein [Vagococcus elongatus]|uniref:LysR family transcriptional regulator n=1 Tax=Vagococcus elongatus TaxID=180344 RepID=A0A430AN09_9ENTE|nr:LysR family transcriptional regulator [Vagococcus elongatus]RSU09353.1 LysR family transcriptional regulator [Vagococcus elongatus]
MEKEMTYTLTLRLVKEGIFFGPGVVRLLELVEKKGSLNSAAREMHMSYNKAWRIMQNAEKELGFPLILSSAGGADGGGSKVTDEGKRLKESYLAFQEKVYEVTEEYFKEVFLKSLGGDEK